MTCVVMIIVHDEFKYHTRSVWIGNDLLNGIYIYKYMYLHILSYILYKSTCTWVYTSLSSSLPFPTLLTRVIQCHHVQEYYNSI